MKRRNVFKWKKGKSKAIKEILDDNNTEGRRDMQQNYKQVTKNIRMCKIENHNNNDRNEEEQKLTRVDGRVVIKGGGLKQCECNGQHKSLDKEDHIRMRKNRNKWNQIAYNINCYGTYCCAYETTCTIIRIT